MNTQNKHDDLNQAPHPILGVPQAEAHKIAWEQPGIASSVEQARKMGAVTLASGTTELGNMYTGKPTINALRAKDQ